MLNVSHTTVSRSLNDSPLISVETKEKVKELAKKHNYRPNVSARGLVLSKSYTIGLFFSTLRVGTSANFFLKCVRGVNSIVKDTYNLAVEAIDDYGDFGHVNRGTFDGIIVMSQSPNDDEFISHIVKEEIPLVVLNREIRGQSVTTILSDDMKGAYELTRYLINCGHRDIAIIEGKPEFLNTHKRKQGFVKAHIDAGLEFNEGYALPGKYDHESGYQAMQRILEMSEMPTAVFCSNDEMALGAMKAIKQRNIDMPDQISITGFDDMGFTAYLTPALTSVLRPIEEMSKKGAQILLNKINRHEDFDNQIIQLPAKLIIRDSVKKLN